MKWDHEDLGLHQQSCLTNSTSTNTYCTNGISNSSPEISNQNYRENYTRMFRSWSKPLSDPAECGRIGTTQTKVSGGKKVSGRKKSERRTKSRLKKERRDTCCCMQSLYLRKLHCPCEKWEPTMKARDEWSRVVSGSRFAVHTWYRVKALPPHGNC